MRKFTVPLAAATFVVAAGGALLPVSPAAAAACPGATGVTVVVDFHELGGGIKTGCAATGGGKAGSINFPAAGFPLTYAQRTQGFVCRVSDKPAEDPCINTPPVTAYWSLWWSDGKTGDWSYSSLGVGALKVPTGGYVAFSWQGQAAKAAPGLPPTKRLAPPPSSAPPKPTKSPSKSPSKSPTVSPSKSLSPSKPANKPGQTATPPSSAETSLAAGEESLPADETSPPASESPSGSPLASDEPTQLSASEDATEAAGAAPVTSDPPTSDADGLPTWLTVSLLVALAAAIGAAGYFRGRRTQGP